MRHSLGSPRAWRLLRRWALEPIVAGYAAAGMATVLVLQQSEAPELSAAALNELAYRVALVLSFCRAVLFPGLQELRRLRETLPDDE